jgi:putative colanic acid biosynthesis acetyltransferase WcaF
MKNKTLDLASYNSNFSIGSKLGRALWQMTYLLLFRPSPIPFFAWRNLLLRCFGARLEKGVHVYPSVKIWAPWNLEMGEYSCLASWVDCYCVATIVLGAHSTVSQYSYLCAATHDYEDPKHRLLPGPINIGPAAWIAADVFIGPNVNIGEGAVIGARASVFKDIPAWCVAVGNPAKPQKKRVLKQI